jgi:hypothetical protein
VVRWAHDGPAGTVQATVSGPADALVAEVAWVVATPSQGRGVATEAAQAVVEWLREQGVVEVVAHVHPDHQAQALPLVATSSPGRQPGSRPMNAISWSCADAPSETGTAGPN